MLSTLYKPSENLSPSNQREKPGLLLVRKTEKDALSEHEREFIENVAIEPPEGKRFEIMARAFGYTVGQANRLLRRPEAREALRAQREASMLANAAPRAAATLLEIMEAPRGVERDGGVPASVKAKSAMWILAHARDLTLDAEKRGDPTESLGSMGPDELERFAAELRSRIVTEANTIEGEAAPIDTPALLVSDLF
jgi:hypothetical protein